MANEPQKIEYLQFETENGSTSNLFRIPHTYEDVGAAPGGYGLGSAVEFLIDDIDTICKPGWYYCSTNDKQVTIGGIDGSRFWMLVKAYGEGGSFATQELYVTTGTNIYKLERNKTKSGPEGWQPWDCINPPMLIGKEYRTIERYKNQPVYTVLIDCGTTPTINNGTGTHSFIVPDYSPSRIIRHSPHAYYPLPYAHTLTAFNDSWNIFSNVAINIQNGISKGFAVSTVYGYNRSGSHIYNQVWYTK